MTTTPLQSNRKACVRECTKKKTNYQNDELLSMLFMAVLMLASFKHFAVIKWALLVLSLLLLMIFFALVFLVTRFPKERTVQPMRASRFRPENLPRNIDTIVIGSGSGGSTCANLLARSGRRVLVLEQHPTATGGCTHSFRENGCEWDTGLHYTSKAMSKKTARPGAIMDFMTSGVQTFTPLDDPYDEIVFPPDEKVKKGAPNNSSYPFVTGAKETVETIMDNIDPQDEELKKRARTYLELCLDINDGFTALGLSRILPSCLQFLVRGRVERLMTFAVMTVRDVQHAVLGLGYTVDELLRRGPPTAPDGVEPDPSVRRLKAVLTHPIGDYAVQPREATAAAHGVTMAHYVDGGSYTVGATQKISVRLTSMVRSFGGDVFIDVTVRSIIVENGRAVGVRVCNTSALAGCRNEIEMADIPLTEIRAKNVVCATSIYNLYTKLLPQDLPVVKKFQDVPLKRSVRQSNGHVFLFCKIKGDASELKLPTHNLWYFNGYDLDDAFDAYFANPTEVRPPTVYIGFPCTKDTTWKKRFPGVSNCILISDGLYEWFHQWADDPCKSRGAAYETFKDKLTHHLLEILYEKVPQVRGKVEFHLLGTPLTEVTYLGSYRGGSYGTQCNPKMFDPINRSWTTTPHTLVPGLYLAGSDAFLPSVVGAMYGGCLGACAVLGHLGTLRLGHALLSNLARRLREVEPSLSWVQAYRQALNKFMNE